MVLDTNLIVGNGQPSIIRSNIQNTPAQTAELVEAIEKLENNVEDAQRFSTKIGQPLKGSNIDIFS